MWSLEVRIAAKPQAFEFLEIALTRALVELAGFEPAAPSLRKMRSKSSEQGF